MRPGPSLRLSASFIVFSTMAAEHASLPVVFASSRRGQETGSQGKPRTNAATISLSFGATTMWFKIVGCRYSITGFTYGLPTENHDNVILKRASRRSTCRRLKEGKLTLQVP